MAKKKSNQKSGMSITEFIDASANAGKLQIIDIGAERIKEKYIGVEEFAEMINHYSFGDFMTSSLPYYDLMQYSRGEPGLFEQLSLVMKDTVASKSKGENDTVKRLVEKEISYYRDNILPNFTEAVNILEYINKVEADPETVDKVSVLPLMCGSGKSTAITKKIIEVIRQKSGLGMLIVTDSVKRLGEIWNEKTKNPLLSKEEIAFIKEHKKDVTILTSETYAEGIARQSFSPVLCMTTQRFFYVLTKEEIKELLIWNDNGEERKRPLILFDEEPFLNEVYDLTPKTVNDIDTMLYMVLDDTSTKQIDKEWCIKQWEAFRERFLDLLWQYEHSGEGNTFYHEEPSHCLTEDDKRFFSIMLDNRGRIRTDSTEVFKSLYAMKAFADTWSIYSHRPGKEYESKFIVYVDNSDKVKDLDAKVMVLDGTGDISPTYDGLDYIDKRNGQSFVRSLSHLTVRIGEINTSKQNISTNKSLVPKAIISYLNSVGYDKENAFIFTYKQHEKKFSKAFKDRTEHFGNIKGKNDYSDETCIAQVGLNQLQPVQYLVHLLARHEELRTSLVGLSMKENYDRIKSIMKETHNCTEVMISHLLADIDQNMFRSAIRSAKNRKDVVYYIFYSDRHAHGLIDAIRERYRITLGAHIETVDEGTIMNALNEKDTSDTGNILRWYLDWDGEPIRRIEILEDLNMKEDNFKKAVSRNDRLSRLFTKARENAKRYGYSRGWYAK